MGKRKQLFIRCFEVVLIILLLVLTIINIKLYIDYKNEYKNKQIIKNNYHKEITNLNNKIIENNNYLDNLVKKYQNIDEEINSLKDEFFSKAKELENKVLNNETDKKIVYLTFDDGPYLNSTNKVLDILKENNILATFFILYKKNDGLKNIYKREYIEGHTIANHTASHKIKEIYKSVDAFINDIKVNEEFIKNKFDGYTTNIMRFPGGSPTAGKLKQGILSKLRTMNYGYVDWDLETGDGNGRDKNNPVVSYNNVFDNLKNKKIVVLLMHDYSNVTIESLPKIINEFKKRNFIFLPLFYDSVKVIKN